jgi:hypothetical protein
MSRNGTTRPFPNAFINPPACRSCTGRGRRGFKLERKLRTVRQ